MLKSIFSSMLIIATVLLSMNLKAESSTGKIVFLGDSHMAYTDWNALFSNDNIINRGVCGNSTQDIYSRLGSVIKDNPKKIFLMVGTNDIIRGATVESFILTYDKILHVLTKKLPKTEIYVMTILPANFENDIVYNNVVVFFNENIKQTVENIKNAKLRFLDIHESFTMTGTLKLNPRFSSDGIHLSQKGYNNWKRQLIPYVN